VKEAEEVVPRRVTVTHEVQSSGLCSGGELLSQCRSNATCDDESTSASVKSIRLLGSIILTRLGISISLRARQGNE
jgi:hypothetical protein